MLPSMVVRNKMSQHQRTNPRCLTSVSATKPVPINESSEDMDSVREKIRSGQAFLRVIEYPWGVEFDVVNVEGGK